MPFPGVLVRRGQLLRLRIYIILVSDFIYLQDLSRLRSFRIIGDLLNICISTVIYTPTLNICGKTVSCTPCTLHVWEVGELWTSDARRSSRYNVRTPSTEMVL